MVHISQMLAGIEKASDENWKPSDFPGQLRGTTQSVYLLADGLATQSKAIDWYEPWYNTHASYLSRLSMVDGVRAFSYVGNARHYLPRHTDIDLLSSSYKVFAPYFPRRSSLVTYVPFSFAGPLMVLGLDNWNQVRATDAPLASVVQQLILVQPAIVMADVAVDFLEDGLDGRRAFHARPGLMNFLRAKNEDLRMTLKSAISRLTSEIPVSIIYWPDDQLIRYPESLLNEMQGSGATLLRIKKLTQPSNDTRPFPVHAMVKVAPEIWSKIEEVIASE